MKSRNNRAKETLKDIQFLLVDVHLFFLGFFFLPQYFYTCAISTQNIPTHVKPVSQSLMRSIAVDTVGKLKLAEQQWKRRHTQTYKHSINYDRPHILYTCM